jgi:hypothetical protein
MGSEVKTAQVVREKGHVSNLGLYEKLAELFINTNTMVMEIILDRKCSTVQSIGKKHGNIKPKARK